MNNLHTPHLLSGGAAIRRWLIVPLAVLAVLAAVFAASSARRASADTGTDLTASVSAPSPVAPGANIVYTITLGNTGDTGITNGVVSFNLPTGLTFVGSDPGAGSVEHLGDTLIFFGLTVPANGSVDVTATVVAPSSPTTVTLPVGAAIANPFGGITESDTSNNQSALLNTTIATPPPPSVIDLQFLNGEVTAPATVGAGGTLTYTIYVANTGTSDASNVVVEFPLPTGVSGVTYASQTGADSENTVGNDVFLTVNSLPAGIANAVTLTVAVNVPANASGTLTEAAGVVQIDPFDNISESDETNNAGPATAINTTITALPDLTVSISTADTSIQVGDDIEYDITLTNQGGGDTSGVVTTFQLPNGLTFDNADTGSTQNGYDISVDGSGLVTISGVSGDVALNASDSVDFSIYATAPTSGTFTVDPNTVIADPGNAIPETNEDNNTAPASSIVTTTVSSSGGCLATCYVSTGGDDSNSGASPSDAFATIQHAVDTVEHDGAGTVVVAAGTYHEQLFIDWPMTVRGAGASTTIIDPPATSPTGAIVNISGGTTASPTEFTGFTVQGPGIVANSSGLQAGIYVLGGAVANIHDNTVSNIADAILNGSQYGDGIRVGFFYGNQGTQEIGTATIINNTVTGNQKRGIVVDGPGSSATITNNTVTGVGETSVGPAQNGIEVLMGANAAITSNNVSGNECDTAPDCMADITDLDDYAEQAAGIELFLPGAVTVERNTISNNDQGVFTFSDGSYKSQQFTSTPVIDKNTLTNNRYEGIIAIAGQSNIWGNSIDGGAFGVFVFNADYDATFFGAGPLADVTINTNTIQHATTAAIHVEGGVAGAGAAADITTNNIYYSPIGIEVSGELSGISVKYNTIRYNTKGVQIDAHVSDVASLVLQRNDISSNSVGVDNLHTAGANISATCNYWGATNGPRPAGSGNSVLGPVTFQPWLSSGSNLQYILCDQTAPTIYSYTPSTSGTQVVTQNAYILPRFQCYDSGGSGIDTCYGYVNSGASYNPVTARRASTLTTNRTGVYTFTVIGVDKAGNQGIVSVTYYVEGVAQCTANQDGLTGTYSAFTLPNRFYSETACKRHFGVYS